MIERKSITIYDEDVALTLLKPLNSEFHDQIIVIYEDAYGEIRYGLKHIGVFRTTLNITYEEFDEILNKL